MSIREILLTFTTRYELPGDTGSTPKAVNQITDFKHSGVFNGSRQGVNSETVRDLRPRQLDRDLNISRPQNR